MEKSENSPPPAAAAQATQPTDPLLHPDPTAPMRPPSPPRAFLRPRLPPQALASWGTAPGTKTLLNLFLELSHGDCALHLPAAGGRPRRPRRHRPHPQPPRRSPRGDPPAHLRRPGPLSEKMRPGESPEAAAARAVGEELGERARVRILGAAAEARVEERESASYPGLPARYVLHAVDAEVEGGVPEDGEFETEETGEDEGDGGAITVKRHYWQWVHDDDDGGGDNEHKEQEVAGAHAH